MTESIDEWMQRAEEAKRLAAVQASYGRAQATRPASSIAHGRPQLTAAEPRAIEALQ